MRRVITICLVVMCVMVVSNFASADMFGTVGNQFNIDFVPISGSTNPASGIPAGEGFVFTGVNNDYRMGTYEISNDQWTKFKAAYGAVTGTPSNAYGSATYWTGTNDPTNYVSWYEAAQFVNYLNTSTNHQAAYKFTGTQGTSDYTLGLWQSGDNGYSASNPYRNSNAYYFLPTENEWVKAAYWNGTSLQTWATIGGVYPMQGNGGNGGWNYDYYTITQLWNGISGSQELNGTYNMMGNVWEWMESPYNSGNYLSDSLRGRRGGSCYNSGGILASSFRFDADPSLGSLSIGFRVASVPEPTTLALFGLGGLMLRRKK